MKPDPMTKQEYSINRRMRTFSVPTRASLASFRQSGQLTDDHFHQVVKMVRIRSRIQSHRMDMFSMPVLRQLTITHLFGLTPGKRN